MPDRETLALTLDDFAKRIPLTMGRVAETFLTQNEILKAFGPGEPAAPRSRWQRLKCWLGERLISLGCRLMGPDSPCIS